MLKSRFFMLTVALALLVAACSPLAQTAEPVIIEPTPLPVTSVAIVQSVEIQVLDSQPLQVNAIVRGQLPDTGCTTISNVYQERNGNVITIKIATTTDPVALCAASLSSFEQVIPLDVNNLPAAKYIVNVNGIETSFKLLSRDMLQFKETLVEALNARNFDLLRAFMDESLMIAYWQSEGMLYAPDPAIEQLKANLLNGSTQITSDLSQNLIDLLGIDPASIAGPNLLDFSPLLVSGLGPDGQDQGILFVARQPDGGLYWQGLLFAKDGFKPAPTNTPIPQVTPTLSVQTPVPTTSQEALPTISILAVVKDTSVIIQAHNFPAHTNIKVLMGKNGTLGVDGILVENFDTGNNSMVTLTLSIPEKLHNEKIIAIRLESKSGYYSYNWFNNSTTGNAASDVFSTAVKYIVVNHDVQIYSGPSKNNRIIAEISKGKLLAVTGVSGDGEWWRVVCPDGKGGSCWVSAKSKFTKPMD